MPAYNARAPIAPIALELADVAYAAPGLAAVAGEGADIQVSATVAALEAVWRDEVQARHPELPPVAIVVASGSEGLNVKRWGHWAAARWVLPGGERRGEILIAAELLAHGPLDVLGTLLHEAAHALAFVRGIKDTSRQGRYHNERYRALAVECGLHVDRDERYGWTITRLSDATVAAYDRAIDTLASGLRGYREDLTTPALPPGGAADDSGSGDTGDAPGGSKGSGGGSRTLVVCGCAKPRKLRVSPATLAEGDILCGVCGQGFHEVQP